MQQIPLFVKVVENVPLQEKEAHCPYAFGFMNRSNHLFVVIPGTNVHTMENIAIKAIVGENPMQDITPREVE